MFSKTSEMKSKLVLFILGCILMAVFSNSNAQSGKVPPFRIVQSESKIFKAENLPLDKPIIIIYFSPECEECHQLTKELLIRINEFKNVSIAMITYLSVESVSQFVTSNNLAKYPNIYVGTEGYQLFVKNYYKIEQFPFVALFNKYGDLIKKYYSKEIDLDDLSSRLKNL